MINEERWNVVVLFVIILAIPYLSDQLILSNIILKILTALHGLIVPFLSTVRVLSC